MLTLTNIRKPTRTKFRGWKRNKFQGWKPTSPTRHHHVRRIPHPKQNERRAHSTTTQSSQQPLTSHCKDKLTRSNTSNEHAIQGTSSQRTPPRNTLTPTHKVQSRKNQTGQCRRHKNELAAFIKQGGTRHRTSIGSNGPRFRQDDELSPVKETPKIQQSMDNIIS